MVDDVSTLDQIRTVVSIVRNLASLGQEAKSKGLDAKHAENLNRAIMDLQDAVLDAKMMPLSLSKNSSNRLRA